MTKIRILPEILSNKIAAGEVVERPASVVKELVENALDAGSTRIVVEVERGGRSLIRVADNGSGMGHDDALLALERYATSKIREDKDLFAIQTLGFRGEALPSIASVSRLVLVSREAGAEKGVAVRVEGGRIQEVSEAGAPVGTMVTVRQLFYNTPARRKFMKTVATEMGHISEALASRALSHPEVHFRLVHNSRPVKVWPAAADAIERVADVLGREARKHLLAVDFKDERVAVTGWVAAPPLVRATGQGIYLFVNRRHVRSRIVQHGLVEGFRGRLMKGQFPLAVLYLKVAWDEVDVNVHPTKHEVRFAHPQAVHDGIRQAAAAALERTKPAPASAWDLSPGKSELREAPARPFLTDRPAAAEAPAGLRTENRPPVRPAGGNASPPIQGDHPAAFRQQGPPRQSALWPGGRFADLTVIGQAHNSYIVCQSGEDLVLIDQHAAHERVLYEKLASRQADRPPAVQRLLIPEPVELRYREAAVLEALVPALSGCGLAIEPFGPNTVAVTAVPALLAGRPAGPLVAEIVEKAVEIGVAGDPGTLLDHALKIMACHGAIRARQALTEAQMRALLPQLDACDNPYHCPHGRPTWIRWPRREIEKLFGRIV